MNLRMCFTSAKRKQLYLKHDSYKKTNISQFQNMTQRSFNIHSQKLMIQI